jgi:hypothetical protein
MSICPCLSGSGYADVTINGPRQLDCSHVRLARSLCGTLFQCDLFLVAANCFFFCRIFANPFFKSDASRKDPIMVAWALRFDHSAIGHAFSEKRASRTGMNRVLGLRRSCLVCCATAEAPTTSGQVRGVPSRPPRFGIYANVS